VEKRYVESLCKSDKRIPIKYRTNKKECAKLLNYIKSNDIKIDNNDIFALASWINFKIKEYDPSEMFSEVESIKYGGISKTYDLHIKRGKSYISNGIICHNTVNLPEDVTVEEVAKIYETAWKEGCKGVTIYRKNCRSGVLLDNVSEEEKLIIKKNTAPKRPQILPCDIYHTVSKGEEYFVLIGLLGEDPYEIFAGKNGNIKKSIKKGLIKKLKRGQYTLMERNGEVVHEKISEHINEDQQAITRLISSNLRHGCDVNFIVHQLEKVEGDLLSFSKAISRVLKKYIPDNTKIHGETCQKCGGELVRAEGCILCKSCGFSRCG